MEWQWYRLDHMQVICTLLQTGYHASTLSGAILIPVLVYHASKPNEHLTVANCNCFYLCKNEDGRVSLYFTVAFRLIGTVFFVSIT